MLEPATVGDRRTSQNGHGECDGAQSWFDVWCWEGPPPPRESQTAAGNDAAQKSPSSTVPEGAVAAAGVANPTAIGAMPAAVGNAINVDLGTIGANRGVMG